MSSSGTVHPVAATRVAQHDHTTSSLVMLHGIYGRGRNWLGIARSLTVARPEYACWLVDLPHHGASGPGAHGDTVHGLAQDVADWLPQAGVTPTAILGHSYGGKVALSMAAAAPDTPLQVWVIDSTPEAKPPSGSAYDLLRVIRELPPRFHSREAAQAALAAHGYTVGVAQWMSTNLVRDGESFRWHLDFGAMERLLLDFFDTDLWSVIEHPSPVHDIHILKASESNAITPEAVGRIKAAAGERVHLHHAEGGHWIHAERPEVVTALLVQGLPLTIG
jgi:pimeloyl-ACP methyl ester carboxylesterase